MKYLRVARLSCCVQFAKISSNTHSKGFPREEQAAVESAASGPERAQFFRPS